MFLLWSVERLQNFTTHRVYIFCIANPSLINLKLKYKNAQANNSAGHFCEGLFITRSAALRPRSCPLLAVQG